MKMKPQEIKNEEIKRKEEDGMMELEKRFMLYEEKRADFAGFVAVLKKQTEIGKKLKSARYNYEIRNRVCDPTRFFANEWLEIEVGGYLYKINAAYNSALTNEQQLLTVLLCPEEIQGLIEKSECA